MERSRKRGKKTVPVLRALCFLQYEMVGSPGNEAGNDGGSFFYSIFQELDIEIPVLHLHFT